jgi:hypothetical protein
VSARSDFPPPSSWLICPQCGQKYINRGGHLETCPGPRVQAAEQACDCEPGWRHEKGCSLAWWPEDAA